MNQLGNYQGKWYDTGFMPSPETTADMKSAQKVLTKTINTLHTLPKDRGASLSTLVHLTDTANHGIKYVDSNLRSDMANLSQKFLLGEAAITSLVAAAKDNNVLMESQVLDNQTLTNVFSYLDGVYENKKRLAAQVKTGESAVSLLIRSLDILQRIFVPNKNENGDVIWQRINQVFTLLAQANGTTADYANDATTLALLFGSLNFDATETALALARQAASFDDMIQIASGDKGSAYIDNTTSDILITVGNTLNQLSKSQMYTDTKIAAFADDAEMNILNEVSRKGYIPAEAIQTYRKNTNKAYAAFSYANGNMLGGQQTVQPMNSMNTGFTSNVASSAGAMSFNNGTLTGSSTPMTGGVGTSDFQKRRQTILNQIRGIVPGLNNQSTVLGANQQMNQQNGLYGNSTGYVQQNTMRTGAPSMFSGNSLLQNVNNTQVNRTGFTTGVPMNNNNNGVQIQQPGVGVALGLGNNSNVALPSNTNMNLINSMEPITDIYGNIIAYRSVQQPAQPQGVPVYDNLGRVTSYQQPQQMLFSGQSLGGQQMNGNNTLYSNQQQQFANYLGGNNTNGTLYNNNMNQQNNLYNDLYLMYPKSDLTDGMVVGNQAFTTEQAFSFI